MLGGNDMTRSIADRLLRFLLPAAVIAALLLCAGCAPSYMNGGPDEDPDGGKDESAEPAGILFMTSSTIFSMS